VIDDHDALRHALGRLLHTDGFEPVLFRSAEEFLEVGSVRCPLCLVLDLNLPGISGLQLQERLRRTAHAPPVIVITSHRDPAIRALAEETVCRVPGKAVRGNDPACRDRLDRRKSALLLR
jgi:FixJ family two-component response regulator